MDDKCQGCGGKPDTEMHPCPYADEIHGDNETLCNCCDSCQQSCAADI